MKKFVMVLSLLLVMTSYVDAGGIWWKKKKKAKEPVKTETIKKKSKYEELFKKSGVETAKGNFVTLHKIEEKQGDKINQKIYFESDLL